MGWRWATSRAPVPASATQAEETLPMLTTPLLVTGPQTLRLSVAEDLHQDQWAAVEQIIFNAFRPRSHHPVGIKFNAEERILNGVRSAKTTIDVTKDGPWTDADRVLVREALLGGL